MRKMLGILFAVVFLSGCASRYTTYTLIEGSEDRINSSSVPSILNDPNSNQVNKREDHDREKLVKRVLVDKKTGYIYYFQNIGGTLQVKEPKK